MRHPSRSQKPSMKWKTQSRPERQLRGGTFSRCRARSSTAIADWRKSSRFLISRRTRAHIPLRVGRHPPSAEYVPSATVVEYVAPVPQVASAGAAPAPAVERLAPATVDMQVVGKAARIQQLVAGRDEHRRHHWNPDGLESSSGCCAERPSR